VSEPEDEGSGGPYRALPVKTDPMPSPRRLRWGLRGALAFDVGAGILNIALGQWFWLPITVTSIAVAWGGLWIVRVIERERRT
jgi:hypothetical protein